MHVYYEISSNSLPWVLPPNGHPSPELPGVQGCSSTKNGYHGIQYSLGSTTASLGKGGFFPLPTSERHSLQWATQLCTVYLAGSELRIPMSDCAAQHSRTQDPVLPPPTHSLSPANLLSAFFPSPLSQNVVSPSPTMNHTAVHRSERPQSSGSPSAYQHWTSTGGMVVVTLT